MNVSELTAAEQARIINCATKSINYYTSKVYKNYFSDEELEDLIGETIFKACRAYDNFDPSRAKISTWISTIAKNTVLSEAEKKSHWTTVSCEVEEFDDDDDAPRSDFSWTSVYNPYSTENMCDRTEFMGRFESIACTLSDEEQRILQMLQEGFKPREIAEELGISQNAASVRIFRLRGKLSMPLKALSDEYGFHNGKLGW